jgi:hypothetical protein
MKNLILNTTVLFFACLFSARMNAANYHSPKFDSLSCLQIEGKVNNAEDGIDGECLIELICANEVVNAVELKEGKTKFKFVLEKNKYYAVRISKKGFLDKLISVNTEMLTENDGVYRFLFETSLIQEAAKVRLNDDIVDFPVAIIQFDYEMECFSFNQEYADYIKKELNKVKPAKIKKTNRVQLLNISDLASSNR